MCVHVYTHVQTCVYIYTRLYKHVCTCIHTCTPVQTYSFTKTKLHYSGLRPDFFLQWYTTYFHLFIIFNRCIALNHTVHNTRLAQLSLSTQLRYHFPQEAFTASPILHWAPLICASPSVYTISAALKGLVNYLLPEALSYMRAGNQLNLTSYCNPVPTPMLSRESTK